MLGDEHNHNTGLELFNWYLKSSNFSQILTARDFLEKITQDSWITNTKDKGDVGRALYFQIPDRNIERKHQAEPQ